MKEIISKFLLAGDKFMPKVHLRKPDLNMVFADHLIKTRKELKKLKKQEVQDISNKVN